MKEGHLRRHHYAEAGTGKDGLGRRILRHLVETCDRCKTEWDRLGPFLQDTFLILIDRFASAPPTEVADELLWVDGAALAVHDAHVEQLGRFRRSTLQQLWALRRLPPEKRADAVRNARRRFRGAALAELLLEECRSTVRTNPAEALGWASLVPLVLDWVQGPGAPAWAPLLLARAAAHRANALRVLGDLAAAERTFLDLRRSLGTRPVEDLGVAAELDSLEASLRTAQNRLSDAEELLERAAVAYRYAGDPVGVARVRIQQANVLWLQGEAEGTLRAMEDAMASLANGPQHADIYLTLATITWRILALCALDRFDEAQFLLERHLDDFEASDEPFIAAVLRGLQGRIALGAGELDAATLTELERDVRSNWRQLGVAGRVALF